MRDKIMEIGGCEHLVHPYLVDKNAHYVFLFPLNTADYSVIQVDMINNSQYSALQDQDEFDNSCFYCGFSDLKEFLDKQGDWSLFAVGTTSLSVHPGALQTHLFFMVKSLDEGFYYQIAEYVFSNDIMHVSFIDGSSDSPTSVAGFLQLTDRLSQTNWRHLESIQYIHSSTVDILKIDQLCNLYHRDLYKYSSHLIGLDFGVAYLNGWDKYRIIQEVGVGITFLQSPSISTYEIPADHVAGHIDPSISSYAIGIAKPVESYTNISNVFPLVPRNYSGNLKECSITQSAYSDINWDKARKMETFDDGQFVHLATLYKMLRNVTFLGIYAQQNDACQNVLYHLYFQEEDDTFLEVMFMPAWKNTRLHEYVYLIETQDPYDLSVFEMDSIRQECMDVESIELINLYSDMYIEMCIYNNCHMLETFHLCPTIESEMQHNIDEYYHNILSDRGKTMSKKELETVKRSIKRGVCLQDAIYAFFKDTRI